VTAVSNQTLEQLASQLGLQLKGPGGSQDEGSLPLGVSITGLATLAKAGPDQISFYHNNRYQADLLATKAGAVIIHPAAARHSPVPVLLADKPYVAFAHASKLFCREPLPDVGIHLTAVVHPSARVSSSARISPYVCIGANCEIGDGVVIGASCVIGDDCVVGAGSRLAPNVVLYHGVTLGLRVRLHSGVIIGSDGFGYAFDGQLHVKIEQLGGVRIGNDVEIGSATTVDRGAIDDTIIEDGVKIDNLVQIAHNVRIGSNTIICGCSGLAGSSVIGKNCIIAGAVGVANHVTICDGVTITAMSLVHQSITEPGVYSSGTTLDKASSWKKNTIRFRQLDEIWKRLLRLEKK
jgi:UDP-3-O-[3-hydroxymyristoyl] glucosamine N-acyltransferase